MAKNLYSFSFSLDPDTSFSWNLRSNSSFNRFMAVALDILPPRQIDFDFSFKVFDRKILFFAFVCVFLGRLRYRFRVAKAQVNAKNVLLVTGLCEGNNRKRGTNSYGISYSLEIVKQILIVKTRTRTKQKKTIISVNLFQRCCCVPRCCVIAGPAGSS